jgi:plastocyanin
MLLAAGIVVIAIAFAACSSSGGGSGSSSGGNAAITIKDLKFTTKPVQTGSTVTVQNNDSVAHTVTSDDGKSFNVTVQPGKTATFTAPGTSRFYTFHCNIHSQMHGTLNVQ